MSGVVARGITVELGGRTILDGVDVTVGPQMRLGLVGPNGAGKSTLLRVLAGLVDADQGTVSAVGTVGLLPQEPERVPGETLLGYLGRRTGTAPAEAELHAAADALASDPDGGDRYDAALQRWLDLGGADIDARAAEVCAELGLPSAALEQPTTTLSGGQMARAALAAVLLDRHDVLLLDEPTNDLDLDGLARLEEAVAGRDGALVIVSHDREFLARSVTAVLELDPVNRTTAFFAGGYDAYVQERAVARRRQAEAAERVEDERAQLADQVQAARERSVRGAFRAKHRAPDNDRAAQGARLEAATKGAAKVRALETRLDRLDADAPTAPRREWALRLELPLAERSADTVASLRVAVVRRGAFTLGPVDLHVGWGERIAVLGPNGGGKTTLLAALLGRTPLDEGTQRLGSGVIVGELDQVRAAFDTADDLVAITTAATGWTAGDARTLLAKFGLGAEQVVRPASSLSPGERTRAGLALLMARRTNCLVLDEPTNHLDVVAIEQLEQALATYRGTLLLVSHDRRLLEAVPLDRTVHVDGGRITET